jgi:Chaperone of endosialidase
LGRGVVTQGAQQAQMSLNSGNSGVSNSQVPLNVASQGVGMMGQGFQGAMQGYNNAGNLALGQYRTQVDASQRSNGMWGALGQVGGALIASDENQKENIEGMDDSEGTKAVRKMPVSRYKYKKGVADEDYHIGTMAQDAHKAAGERVAPGGKTIDLISMNGITLAAIRDVDKRLQKLEKRPTLSLKKEKA